MGSRALSIIIIAILVVAGIGAVFFLGTNNADEKRRELTSKALEIYGNADGDFKIDASDAELVEDFLKEFGESKVEDLLKDEAFMNGTFVNDSNFNIKFADANNDGVIDGSDVVQIRGVVDRTADTLWFIDGRGKDMAVGLDIDRIGAEYYANVELCLILGLADKIVAVDNAPYIYREFYFTEAQRNNISNMYGMNSPDYAYINELDLDILLTFYTNAQDEKQEKLIGTDVVYLGLYNPDMSNAEGSNFIQGILKAGYIFGKVERAEEYAEWILATRDKLAEIASSIPEDDKPWVLMSNYPSSYFIDPDTKTVTVYCFTDPLGQACLLGGGRNVGQVLYGSFYNTSLSQKSQIDALFNDDNGTTVDYIFLHNVRYTYAGTTIAAVPDHGYLAKNNTQMAAAWANAVSPAHTLLTDIEPNNVYLIAGDFRNGPTGAVLLGAYIGNILHPSYYAQIDAIALHNHYIRYWLGITDYDVSEDGVFIYPGIA